MDLHLDDPCVLFAMRREARAFYRPFRPQQTFPGAPCRARFCGPEWLTVLVLETGIGPEAIAKILGWLLTEPRFGNLAYRPRLVITAGFAGAAQPGFRVGDVILASEVADLAGSRWPVTWPSAPLTGEWRPPIHRGALLGVPRIVATPEEKRTLGRQYGVAAFDMESMFVAQECRRRDVPFGCLRAISDDADSSLSPALASLLADGRVSLLRLLLGLARKPSLVGEMARLAKHTRSAGECLAAALGELLTLTME
jgi:adenosylhomocysteine nucleosidase